MSSTLVLLLIYNKLRTCLPTLKSPFDKNLKSHVVYKITCNGCSSIYDGQTSRHVNTRISEHQKKDSPVGQHLVECCGTTHNVKREILDACRGVEKLMTIEAIYIKKLKPQLNTRDEYRVRELTLKYYFKNKNLTFENQKKILVNVNLKFCQPQKSKK